MNFLQIFLKNLDQNFIQIVHTCFFVVALFVLMDDYQFSIYSKQHNSSHGIPFFQCFIKQSWCLQKYHEFCVFIKCYVYCVNGLATNMGMVVVAVYCVSQKKLARMNFVPPYKLGKGYIHDCRARNFYLHIYTTVPTAFTPRHKPLIEQGHSSKSQPISRQYQWATFHALARSEQHRLGKPKDIARKQLHWAEIVEGENKNFFF